LEGVVGRRHLPWLAFLTQQTMKVDMKEKRNESVKKNESGKIESKKKKIKNLSDKMKELSPMSE